MSFTSKIILEESHKFLKRMEKWIHLKIKLSYPRQLWTKVLRKLTFPLYKMTHWWRDSSILRNKSILIFLICRPQQLTQDHTQFPFWMSLLHFMAKLILLHFTSLLRKIVLKRTKLMRMIFLKCRTIIETDPVMRSLWQQRSKISFLFSQTNYLLLLDARVNGMKADFYIQEGHLQLIMRKIREWSLKRYLTFKKMERSPFFQTKRRISILRTYKSH